MKIKRKVHFGKVVSHNYIQSEGEVWCRHRFYELYVLDNIRFKVRIQQLEILLAPILKKHLENLRGI